MNAPLSVPAETRSEVTLQPETPGGLYLLFMSKNTTNQRPIPFSNPVYREETQQVPHAFIYTDTKTQ